MDQDRDFRVWQERLRVALRQWEDNKQDEGALYRGLMLSQALEWAKTHHDQLTEKERLFIDRSKELVEREKAEREARLQRELEQEQALREEAEARRETEQALRKEAVRREQEQARASYQLRRLAIGLAVMFLAALGTAWYAYDKQLEAESQARIAKIRQLAAQSDATLDEFPQRSLLLAIESLYLTSQKDRVYGLVSNKKIINSLNKPKAFLYPVTKIPLQQSLSALMDSG